MHIQDAFGQPTSSGASSDPYLGRGAQAGYYRDSETGLYLCTNRYYDPINARFLNRDPIGYQGGMNLYGYCLSNPIGNLDPSGFAKDWLWHVSDFSAGFGDAATFGLTRWIRSLNCANDVVDFKSGAYLAGEKTELAVEVVISGGSAVLKKKAATVPGKIARSQGAKFLAAS